VYPFGNTKGSSLFIREAWIDYQKDIFDLKVGHQGFAQLNKLFFDHSKFGDDGILLVITPNRNVTAALATIKLSEGFTHVITANDWRGTYTAPSFDDDKDAYIAFLQYKGDTFSIAGAVDYVNDKNYYPTSVSMGTGRDSLPQANAVHLWNFALAGDVTFSSVTLRGDVEVQTGQFEDWNTTTSSYNRDIEGYAVLAGIDYKISDTKITLEYGYGSGDDGGDTHAFKTFVTSLGNDQNNTLVYDYKARAAVSSASGVQSYNYGIANTEYIKFGANSQIAKDFSAEAYLFWLQASEAVSLNGDTASRDLGWEADAKVTYNIAKNLKYWVEGGYLWTGSSYNWATTHSSDDAYMVRHGLQLNF
jgi:hypothetical protein